MFKNFIRLNSLGKNGLGLSHKTSTKPFLQDTICFKSDKTNDNQTFKNDLKSPRHETYKKQMETIISLNPEYKKISNRILATAAVSKNTAIPVHGKELQSKLDFKLAMIVACFKRLTQACENNFIDDKTKLDLIKEILANELRNKNIEEIENEFDFLELLGFEVNEEDEMDEILMELNPTEKELADQEFDEFLDENGTKLDLNQLNNFGEKFVEYTEDIVQSVNVEIEEKASELRKDFPGIDKHLKDLQCLITKEWLDDYKDRYLDTKFNQFDFGWENEDGDPEFICP